MKDITLQIQKLHNEGLSLREIGQKVNLHHRTVQYHLAPKWKLKAQEQQRIRRRNFKLKLISLCGSKCSICGYDKSISALDFHHKDPNSKDFSIAETCRFGATDEIFEKCKKEIEKCVLLCSNCHHEIHDSIAG